MAALVAPCLETALAAGDLILSVAGGALDIEHKGDGSPLTRADRAAHDCIVSGLSGVAGGLDLLSEEGDIDAFLQRAPAVFWLVDPLDGTKEFIEGLGEYTVNIALVDHGRPVLGVVVAPALGAYWYGTAGSGAFRGRQGSDPVPVSPSRNAEPATAVVSRSHLSDDTRRFLEANAITRTTARGSSVKICAVAEGSADIYPRHGPTSIWDTAAGTAVARAAGCRVVDGAGLDLDYDPAVGIRRDAFIVFPRGMKYRALD